MLAEERRRRETVKLEREERERRFLEQQDKLVRSAWEAYESRWRGLHDGTYPLSGVNLAFSDIPWPVVGEIRGVTELDRGRLEGFLLWEGSGKQTKQRVRDAVCSIWICRGLIGC